jgi:cytochrome c-type biogenesis protein CcmH/NrfF
MTPLAHAGHWYHALLYLAPVLVVVLALWVSSLRERRDERKRDDEARPPARR